ncbi:hypothetical protein DL770_010277 [Monosporascus sp. CRB-9-2]|nr:hypothetical protein DL770_010277 [Monosporascus sp. CRB-9-2]
MLPKALLSGGILFQLALVAANPWPRPLGEGPVHLEQNSALDVRDDYNTPVCVAPTPASKRDGRHRRVPALFYWDDERVEGLPLNETDDSLLVLTRRKIDGFGSMDQPENGKINHWFSTIWRKIVEVQHRIGTIGTVEIPGDPTINYDPIYIDGQLIDRDESTSELVYFKDKEVGVGVKGMCGCTSVIIVSKKGAYMTHFWDSYFFDAKDGGPLFQKYVLDELTGVSTRIDRIISIPDLPCEMRQDPKRNRIQVAIYSPKQTSGSEGGLYKFQDQVNAIKDVLVQMVVGLDRRDIIDVPYYSRKELSEDLSLADGKVVVLYDPKIEKRKAAYMMWAGSRYAPNGDKIESGDNNQPVMNARWTTS